MDSHQVVTKKYLEKVQIINVINIESSKDIITIKLNNVLFYKGKKPVIAVWLDLLESCGSYIEFESEEHNAP